MEEELENPATGSTDAQPAKDVHPERVYLPGPKRGAFPTPKTEIESARPYIPESDRAGDKSAAQPDSPTKTDQEQQ